MWLTFIVSCVIAFLLNLCNFLVRSHVANVKTRS